MDGQKAPTEASSDTPNQFKPGETITPGAAATPPAPVAPTPATPTGSNPAPQSTSTSAATAPQSTDQSTEFVSPRTASASTPAQDMQTAPVSPAHEPSDEELTQAEAASSERRPAYRDNQEAPEDEIRWTASEFIAHQKSPGWYLMLGVVAAALAFLIWLVTHDAISAAVVMFAAAVFGAYGARQPRQLPYCLDRYGLTIGNKQYAYEEFRSFAIVPEGAFASISFIPLKRFAPLTTIYYDPADEDRIVDLLSERLPLEERGHDLIDWVMHRIRF